MNRVVLLSGIFLLLTTTFLACNAAKILFAFPFSPPSHHVLLKPLISKLSNIHEVTVLTSNPDFVVENVTFIRGNDMLLAIAPDFVKDINNLAQFNMKNKPFPVYMEIEKHYGPKICNATIMHEFFHQKISSKFKYDLVLITGAFEDCSSPLAAMLSDRVIFVSFMRQLMPPYAYYFNAMTSISLFPNVISDLTASMTISQRFQNFFTTCYWLVSRKLLNFDSMIQKQFPKAPFIEDSYGKLDLVFTNSDNVLSEPVPNNARMIKIAGMHIGKSKQLPNELNNILNESKGFILFSMGTLAELSSAGNNVVAIFIKAFANLEETVIWKTSEIFQDLPSNIKTFKWIPQQDILAHSKIRLLIGQGGIFGLQEAIYNGVPVLGNPVFVDQFSNIKRIEELGMGKQIKSYENISSSSIYSDIREIIDDPRFKMNAVKYSKILRDELENNPPLEKAVFWVDKLLKQTPNKIHNKYWPQLNFIQYLMIDIIVFFLFVTLSLYIFVKIMVNLFYAS